MKKSLTTMMLLCGLLAGLWAQTVTIGTGTSTTLPLPMNCWYVYSYTQSIYYQTEIGAGQTISKIAYNYTGASWTDSEIKIYMGHTTKTTFASTTDWIPVANLAEVFSGAVTVAPGWVEITLTTPFVYNGTDNLVIAFDKNLGGDHGQNDDFYSTATSGVNRAIRNYSDTVNPDPATPPTGTLVAGYANIKLIQPATVPVFEATPTSKNFGSVSTGSSSADQIFTVKNSGAGTLNISAISLTGTNANQFVLTDANTYPVALAANQTMTVNVKFAPLAVGAAAATLRIVSDAKVDHDIALTGTGMPPVLFSDDFESYADFSTSFDPWTVADLDTHLTYGIQNVTFPNAGTRMAYIIFNPSQTTPATTTQPAHSGAKYAACFNASPVTGAPYQYDNDWMISPKVTLGAGSSVGLWVKSATAQYGLERYNVAVSTTNTDPANFTVISGSTYQEAPATAWTEVNYSLAAYDGQQVYIGIQCVSQDAFYFMVDDFKIYTTGGSDISNDTKVKNCVLSQNFPNPFNPETTINFTLTANSDVKLAVYNARGEMVKELVNEVRTAGSHSVKFNGAGLNSGVYFYKLITPNATQTQKMILVK